MRKKLLILILITFLLPFLVYGVLRVTKFFGRAFGKKANLVIDMSSSHAVFGGTWKNLAQGGEEKGRMLLPVVNKVAGLRPEYIRIDHVFDSYDVVGRDGSGSLTFNWTNLDLTLGDISSSGAKPFIALSYMPPVVSKSDIVDLPQDWSQWELSVQRLVEHLSGRSGLNLSGVYYEVWNEPDLFGRFKTGGEKSYLELYAHTVSGASRAQNVNSFKIGGPATTGLYENWFEGLLKFSRDNGLRLDFLSWHRYSKKLDDYENDYLNARRWLEDLGMPNLELIISEIGPNSENDPVYDQYFAAIHTIATSALLENKIQKTFLFEIKDGPGGEKYWGRWGLFTHEKFAEPEAKPRVAAIQFLNRMVGEKIGIAGEGSWVKAFAKRSENITRTLVVNYDPGGRHFEAVPMTFINLPQLNFLFRRIDFSGGSKEISVATSSATWATIQEFGPNSAAIFEIIPVK